MCVGWIQNSKDVKFKQFDQSEYNRYIVNKHIYGSKARSFFVWMIFQPVGSCSILPTLIHSLLYIPFERTTTTTTIANPIIIGRRLSLPVTLSPASSLSLSHYSICYHPFCLLLLGYSVNALNTGVYNVSRLLVDRSSTTSHRHPFIHNDSNHNRFSVM